MMTMTSLQQLIDERSQNIRVEVRPGKGRCVIANRNFAVGELVSEERATVLLDNTPYQAAQTASDFPASLDAYFDAIHWPPLLDELHGFLGPQSKREYLEPVNAVTKKRVGILEANQFDFPSYDAIGLAAFTAMFNHACYPSCAFSTDGDLVRVHTRRAVKEGQELTIQYCPTTLVRKERKQWLKDTYGFDCDCNMCCSPEGDFMRVFHCPRVEEGTCGKGAKVYAERWHCASCGNTCSQEQIDDYEAAETYAKRIVEQQGSWAILFYPAITERLHVGHALMKTAAEDAAKFVHMATVAELAQVVKVMGKSVSRDSELFSSLDVAVKAAKQQPHKIQQLAAQLVDQAVMYARLLNEVCSAGGKSYSPEVASLLTQRAQYLLCAADLCALDPFDHGQLVKDAQSCLKEARLITMITHGKLATKYVLLEKIVAAGVRSFGEYEKVSEAFLGELQKRWNAEIKDKQHVFYKATAS